MENPVLLVVSVSQPIVLMGFAVIMLVLEALARDAMFILIWELALAVMPVVLLQIQTMSAQLQAVQWY